MSDTTDNVDDIVEERDKTLESALSQIKMQKGSSDEEARKSPSCLDWSTSEFLPSSAGSSSTAIGERTTPDDKLEALRKKERLRNMQEHQEIQCLQSQQERKQGFDERAKSKARSVSRRRKSPESKETKDSLDSKKSNFPPLPPRRPDKIVITGNLSDPPLVNTWEERKRKQSALCELTPASTEDELNMVVKALEISKLDTGPIEKLQNCCNVDEEAALKEAIERSKKDFGPNSLGFHNKSSDNPSNGSGHSAIFEQSHFGNRQPEQHFRGMRRSGSRRSGRNRGYRGGRGGDRCTSPSIETSSMRNPMDFRATSRGQWQHGDNRGHRVPLSSSRGNHATNYERATSDTSEDWEKEMRESQKHEVSPGSSNYRRRNDPSGRPAGKGSASPHSEAEECWREKMERSCMSERGSRKEDIEERHAPSFPGNRARPTEFRSHKFSSGNPTLLQREHDRGGSVSESAITTHGKGEMGDIQNSAASSRYARSSPSPLHEQEPQCDKDGSDKKVNDVPFDVWLQMCDKYLPLLTKGMAHFQKSLSTYHNLGGAVNGSVSSPTESPHMVPMLQPHSVSGPMDMNQFPPYMVSHVGKDHPYVTGRPPDKGYAPVAMPGMPSQVEGYPIMQPLHHPVQMYMSQYPMQPVEPVPHYMTPGVTTMMVNHTMAKAQQQVGAPQLHPGHYAGSQVSSAPMLSSPSMLAAATKPSVYGPPPQHYFPAPNSQPVENTSISSAASPSQVASVTSSSKLNPQAQSFDFPSASASGLSSAPPFPRGSFRPPSNYRVRNCNSRQDNGLGFSSQVYAGKPRHGSPPSVRFPSPRRGSGHFLQEGSNRSAPQ
ncbi:uncharacterized protein LOC135385656 isoform X2 [Ornithodoros turicata]|uniref:uncharacterized protein LOC135385656 isoform X2 n=1 Tax=Ornithodoros turicata TaxID=34597 RepID=UPI003139BA6D